MTLPILAFYTKRTPYERDAVSLKLSCKRRGHPVVLVGVDRASTWEETCAMKATVVRDALKIMDRFLFLDADCNLQGSLASLEAEREGIMLHIVRQIKPGMFANRYLYQLRKQGMWNSGVMLINRSPDMLELAEAWVEMCKRRVGEWDQICLQAAHQEIKSTVPVRDLPAEFRAGGKIIGHRSGFHRHWKKQASRVAVRRVLLIGSAPYALEWWRQNRERYLNAGFQIVAINNACAIVGDDDLHLWLKPNDYAGDHHAGDIVPRNENYPRATNKEGNWIWQPYRLGEIRTTAYDSITHLINEAVIDRVKLSLHLVGLDMIYSGSGQTHFYGNSSADPLRYSDELHEKAQRQILTWANFHKFEVLNVGGQEQTRLIFDRA